MTPPHNPAAAKARADIMAYNAEATPLCGEPIQRSEAEAAIIAEFIAAYPKPDRIIYLPNEIVLIYGKGLYERWNDETWREIAEREAQYERIR